MNNFAEQLILSIETGLVDSKIESNEDYRPQLLINDTEKGNAVLCSLEKELNDCESFIFSVAFITMSGVTVLIQTLKELAEKNIKGKILTTNYLYFSEPKALKKLIEFSNLEVRMYTNENFHTKGYLFQKKDKYTLIVGSSNLTQNALKKNKEWNLRITSTDNGMLVHDTLNEFYEMWNDGEPLTEELIQEYAFTYQQRRKKLKEHKVIRLKQKTLRQNKMQMDATRNLEKLRLENKNKAILISATGTGKTYLSAFDARNFNPKKLLFLVHREQILVQAEDSFKDVLGEDLNTGFLTGNKHDISADYLFSTIQTMSKDNVLSSFSPEYFDYIIIDETHKAGADSYLKIMNYFRPKFLLGMTATPERMDGFNVFELFNYNIAYEIRLQQAMQEDLLCPFHYFGITELLIEGKIVDDTTDFLKLTSDERVNNIIDKINFYGYSGERVKGLIFCSRIEEAKRLSELFNLKGYQTISLSGADSQEKREVAIEKLESNERKGGLDYIFTVDIFNEGVDIPAINQVVMLRPTESAIIFVQQLGRGLRKYEDKEYVVVIDFIGNYTKNFLIPIALSGDKTYNKDTIRKYVAEGNRVIPGCSTINFDRIAKERIYASIDNAKFSDVRFIKEKYMNLKNMIGRIPKLMDFEEYGAIDVLRIFENQSLGSYHNFLTKYDKDYKIELNKTQEEMLVFISKKLASGKRIHELLALKRLLTYRTGIMSILNKDLKKQYDISLEKKTEISVANVLMNQFPTGTGKETYKHSIFIEKEQKDDYRISGVYDQMLDDQNFRTIIEELIDFGIMRHEKYYRFHYQNTSFQLYQKYNYEDVCKLLGWEQNVVAQNIGGYKYDNKTNTFPVFINYEKDDNISDSIKYEDRFLTPTKLIALSKQNRDIKSQDIVRIYNAEKSGMDIFLFVRKNKDDKSSKEFYFLGRMKAVGKPNPIIMGNTKNKAVEISYQLETPVREDIYDYITSSQSM